MAASLRSRMVVALLSLNVLVLGGLAHATDASKHASELRAIAVRIKSAVDHAADRQPPSMTSAAALRGELARFSADESKNPHSELAAKTRATGALLTQLDLLASGAVAPFATGTPPRSAVDLEVVSDRRGNSCASAFGISPDLPVVVTLAGADVADAGTWFRFEPNSAGFVRFATDSTGPDPALAIFASCSAAHPLTVADDTLGLDAAVVAAAGKRRPLYAHLTNSGPGGAVRVNVAIATGSISGKITDADSGQPIAGATVTALTTSGGFAGSQTTDLAGNYTILPFFTGDFLVLVQANLHVAELYPAAPCGPGYPNYGLSACATAQAQSVAVADGAALTGINLALASGNAISGTVRGGTPAAPIDAGVILYDKNGSIVDYTTTDPANGGYRFATLIAGDYRLSAASGAYGSQLFDHVACGGPLQSQCDPALGGTVKIASSDVSAIDFDLPRLAAIKGSVTGDGGQPLPGIGTVYAIDNFGNVVAQANTDSFGRYNVGPLPVGSFYVYAIAGGFFPQIFDGIDCGVSCLTDLAQATPVTIASMGDVAHASFQLRSAPPVHGHVQDALRGYPIANAEVRATTFSYGYTNAFTDINGDYTLYGLQSGQYYLWALSNDHVDQIYSGISCELNAYPYSQNYTCSLVGATLLTIARGDTPPDFNFQLNPSSSIAGRATVRSGMASSFPASGIGIALYDSAGNPSAGATTDASGKYVINDLAPGTYYAVAKGGYNGYYVSEVWPDGDCPQQCLPVSGAPIVVGTAQAVSGIDFDLLRIDAVVGRVTNTDGNPLPGTFVDLFRSADETYFGSGIADDAGYYIAHADTGAGYFLATDTSSDYFNQVYSGISCPLGAAYEGLCSLSGASAVAVPLTAGSPHVVNFVLASRDPIFANGFEF